MAGICVKFNIEYVLRLLGWMIKAILDEAVSIFEWFWQISPNLSDLNTEKLAISKRLQVLLEKFQAEGTVRVSQVVLEVKNPPANAGDIKGAGSLPRLGRPPGKGNGYPLQCFLFGESHGQRSLVDWVHWVAKSQTQVKRVSTQAEGTVQGSHTSQVLLQMKKWLEVWLPSNSADPWFFVGYLSGLVFTQGGKIH